MQVSLWTNSFYAIEPIARIKKQECIPVGCVQSAELAISWGGGSTQEGVCLEGVCPALGLSA